MKYSDFFPSYPSLDNYETIYQELYKKKEFYDLKGIGELNDFRHYQLIPARFLSPWTFYQRLLLLHDTGTGKSATICAALDLLKKNDPNVTFIYLVSNDTLVKNFKGYKNTAGKWQKGMIEKHCHWAKTRLETESWTNVNSFFRRYGMYFSTFGSFKRDLEKINKSRLRKVFLVLDEAHHLITKNVLDKKSNYSFLMDFIKNIRDLKLLVSTATPMRDDALEIIYLLNMVVPIPFPTGKEFFKKYLVIEEGTEVNQDLNVYHFQAGRDVRFRNKLAGYVSVVRQKIENVYPVYMGNLEGTMKSTKITIDNMESYQTNVYMNTWEKRNETNDDGEDEDGGEKNELDSLYNNSIQASLMVFPPINTEEAEVFKPYGRFATQKFLVMRGNEKNRFNKFFFEQTKLIESPQSSEEMKQNLDIIKKYSIVYHDIIRNILKAKKNGKCIYVYSEKINGSGILRCIYLLHQCFNFEIVDSKKNIYHGSSLPPGDRLIFLADQDIQDLVASFNDPKNRHGEYFRVIFGTDKTTEGITLKNIQEIHITTPGWNFGKKNQAEGRGIRISSHEALLKEMNEIHVNIYLHCASPNNLQNSVNYLQYVRSEIKERNINLFQYQMLIGAIDCQLNYEQNFRSNAMDGSAECYFEKCEYECDGIKKKELTDSEIQKGNFNTYFLDANKNIIKSISKLYSYNNIPRTFDEIKQYLGDFHYSDFQIYYTINTIIDTPIMIVLDNGNKRFLVEQDGFVFTTPTREITQWHDKKPILESSSIAPRFSIQEDTDSLLIKLYHQEDYLREKMAILREILEKNNIEQIVSFFQSFPLFVQNIMINLFPKLEMLKNAEYNSNTKKLKYKDGNKTHEINFNNATPPVEGLEEKDLQTNELGFYAIQSGKTFKIRDISDPRMLQNSKTKTKGQDINTIKVFQLIYYISKLFDSVTEQFENMVPRSFLNRLNDFKNTSQEDILKSFDNYSKDHPIFTRIDYSFESKKLIVFLKELFSSKKIRLVNLLKEEMKSRNLVVQE